MAPLEESVKQAPSSLHTLKDSNPDISNLRILIIHTEWNKTIIDNLLKHSILTLQSLTVKQENIFIQSVPGSYELPWACNSLRWIRVSKWCEDWEFWPLTWLPRRALSNTTVRNDIDAIIAIGVLIKGDTMHFEYIADSVSKNLSEVSIKHNKPIIFGVLTCLTEEQALIRSGLLPSSSSNHNHAIDWAKAAVDCALNSRRFSDHKTPLHSLFRSAREIASDVWSNDPS